MLWRVFLVWVACKYLPICRFPLCSRLTVSIGPAQQLLSASRIFTPTKMPTFSVSLQCASNETHLSSLTILTNYQHRRNNRYIDLVQRRSRSRHHSRQPRYTASDLPLVPWVQLRRHVQPQKDKRQQQLPSIQQGCEHDKPISSRPERSPFLARGPCPR